jgi:NAD(P)H-hydrate repair Nnr-like enzyme with NAD(P)H-hydrate epimerase domain
MKDQEYKGGLIRVPTGLFGWGTPRYFKKKDVEIIEECNPSTACSCAMGIPVTIRTKDGEVLKGYEDF